MADEIPAWMMDELRQSESLEIARLRTEITTLKARIAELERDIERRKTLLRECADGLFFATDEPKWKLRRRIHAIPGVMGADNG